MLARHGFRASPRPPDLAYGGGSMTVAESDRRAENLAAFERYMPEVYAVLHRHVPETRLVENPDGSHDIEFRNQRLYDVAGDGTTGPQLAKRAAEALKGSSKQRLLMIPLDRRTLDETSSQFVAQLLKKGVDDGATFLELPNDDGAYHLIVMGMGLGYHLAEYMALCRPYSICIVEPNVDFLYHSLSTFDWRPLLERRAEWPTSVTVLQTSQADVLARQMRFHCRHTNPAGTDSTLFAESYANDMMQSAVALFRRDAHLIHTGLGFHYDEMEMVRAAYGNLVAHDDYRVFKRTTAKQDLPAFIIGSGPSIDDDIDFIRENQDRAVIFSCGSALGVLLANGIRPDFQMQLENGEPPREVLEAVARRYDFSGIRLIGSNTISPQTRNIFDERIFFMRQSLSSYAMFSPGREYSLERAGPTVTNTGLDAALQSGFQEIYLFGCDLGARSPERHHSRFSPYHQKERDADYDAAVVFAQKLPQRELGNFGGIAFTNEILLWSRDAMEASIVLTGGGRMIYNCSDGIRIKGARPQVSSAIRLKPSKTSKAEAIDRLVAQWPEAATFDFRQRFHEVDWRERVRQYADRLIEICESAPERTQELVHRFGMVLIADHTRAPAFEEFFLRGTIFVSMISTDFYARRVHPPEKVAPFRAIAYAEMIALLRMMVDQSDWFFDNLERLETNKDLKEGLRVWTENRMLSLPA
jgi:hypothetical protein